MEPHDLNRTPPDEAALESWLRNHAALPPLPDGGFAQQVVAALPAPHPSRVWSRRRAGLTGALAGTAFAAFEISTSTPAGFTLPALSPEAAAALAQLSDPTLLLAVGVAAGSLALVFWRDASRWARL